MKPTKRAKKVKVRWIETRGEYSVYICPSCKTEFHGCVNKRSTRFKCDCGQELIVENSK